MSRLKLDMQDIQFGPTYSPVQMRQIMNQLNAVTRFTQKLLQMLQAGQDSQVLTKVQHEDLVAEWRDASGGGFSITLEEGTLLGRAEGAGPGEPQQIEVGSNLLMTGDVLSAVVPVVPPVSADGYPPELGHAGI